MATIAEVRRAEFALKRQKVKSFLQQHRLDGIWLVEPANIAWLTCGGNNRIDLTSPWGSFGLLVTGAEVIAVAGNNEMPRVQAEELQGLGITAQAFGWYEGYADLYAARSMQGGKCASDRALPGFSFVGQEFASLRFQLTAEEQERYRRLAADTGEVLATVGQAIRQGDAEYQIAAMLAKGLYERGIVPCVLLVAADERIANYRHPVPTAKTAEQMVMLSLCGQRAGLVVSQTRLLCFGAPEPEIRRKQQAVLQVEAEMLGQTFVGNSLQQIFAVIVKAYEQAGFPGEWKMHHQGGPAGYKGRESIVTPDSTGTVLKDQAFAWNPTITGIKTEDTIIASSGVPELLGQIADWPYLCIKTGNAVCKRPDILVRKAYY